MPDRAGTEREASQAREVPAPGPGPEPGDGSGTGGLLRRIGLAEVYNPSMRPTLLPGDQLLVVYGAAVHPGDVVVLRHPFQHDLLIVKRAVRRRPGGWWVQGDNPAVRNDSREFGAVPDELVVARALLRLRSPRGLQPSLRSAAGWARSAVRPLVRPPLARRFRAR